MSTSKYRLRRMKTCAECGHHMSAHRYEPDHPRRGPGPCTIPGCACREFRVPKPGERIAKKNPRLDPLRHVRLDDYTLETWDTGRTDRYGKTILAYEFRKPNGAILFEGEDFAVPPMDSIDGDASLRSLLGFLTLRPGDTDREYFDNYTKEQMAFAKGDAEQLQMYADPDGPEFENVDDFEANASFRFSRSRKFGEPLTKGRYYVEVDPEIIVEVKDYAEASKAVRLYIERTGMGSTEWYGLSPTIGRVTFGSKSGKAVARVSYNGRVWTPDEKTVLHEAAR